MCPICGTYDDEGCRKQVCGYLVYNLKQQYSTSILKFQFISLSRSPLKSDLVSLVDQPNGVSPEWLWHTQIWLMSQRWYTIQAKYRLEKGYLKLEFSLLHFRTCWSIWEVLWLKWIFCQVPGLVGLRSWMEFKANFENILPKKLNHALKTYLIQDMMTASVVGM